MKKCKTLTISIGILIFLSLSSCTFKTSKSKDPIFKTENSVIQQELNNIISFEKISVSGKEVVENTNKYSILEIEIINTKNVPEEYDQIKEKGKSIAKLIKNSLQDPNEYNKYLVNFVAVEKNGAYTSKNIKGAEYESADL